jgi:hypothetical protein
VTANPKDIFRYWFNLILNAVGIACTAGTPDGQRSFVLMHDLM